LEKLLDKEKEQEPSMARLSRYFLNGVIVLVPIAITSFVVTQVFTMTDSLVGKYLPVQFPGLPLIVMAASIILIGWLSSYWFGRRILLWTERLLARIPLVKFIYNSVKQVSTAMLESKSLLKQAVLVPYPHSGVYALGFITGELSAYLASKFPEEHVCIFIPFSLNLTAGVNILVPQKDVIMLDVTSESVLQYVLTAGSIMPRSIDAEKC